MLLFIKGFIIGIGKIIPGVSGAMLAINFNVYERLIDTICDFFSDWKSNLKFIMVFGFGVILAMITCSKMIIYLLNNYFFITMMFFIGLIFGGVYNFSKGIKYNIKNILVVIIVSLLFMLISFGNIDNEYILRGNFTDSLMFFIGGIIEIFASIVPGISGTALQMILGIYDNVLVMISNIYNVSYIISNINIYISYGIGIIISFIVTSYLMRYLLSRYKNMTYLVILGLCIGSIIFLLIITFRSMFSLIELILGIMVLVVGLLGSCILDK